MKYVIVTGASKGLGLEVCKNLINNGYYVVAISRSQPAALLELIESNEDRFFHYSFDFIKVQEIKELCADILKKHGRPYGLVNNAAIGTDGVLGTMHESEISTLLKVNIEAPILMCKYLSRSMLINGVGRIINVSSIISNTGYSGLSVYAASKAALVGFSKSLAREIGKGGVTVNTLAPGFMNTDMTSTIKGEQLAKIERRSALKRLATTEHVAKSVVYLLSDAGGSITGTTLVVDSGSTA